MPRDLPCWHGALPLRKAIQTLGTVLNGNVDTVAMQTFGTVLAVNVDTACKYSSVVWSSLLERLEWTKYDSSDPRIEPVRMLVASSRLLHEDDLLGAAIDD
jgi:hypothetical protein